MIKAEKEYILPTIQLKESLQKEDTAVGHLYGGFNKSLGSFNELYTYEGLVIVAEPGNGKSRLLKEIVLNASQNNHIGILIDLKKIGDNSIEAKIKQYLGRESGKPGDKEISDKAIYTDGFVLSKENENIIVCLDALDEVKSNLLFDYLDSIKQFQNDYPLVKIVLSSRDYIYKRYEDVLKEFKLQLLEIKPFSTSSINHYLQRWGFSNEEIMQVLNKFTRDYNLEVINSPRVLEIFASLKSELGIEKLLKMNKAELLEAFIYEKLDLESNDTKKYNDLIKRVLEKLALTMEINQSKEITKDELMTFFDDINSNLAGNFLSVINIDDFYERLLLVPSYDGKKIQFQNAEFQEYLAAKEITRFERTDQALFDLAIDRELHEIYSSWANLIQYLVLLDPKILPTLVEYLTRLNHSANSQLLERILLSDRSLILHNLTTEDIEKIFTSVFNMHQEQSWFLKYDLVNKLPLYFTPQIEVLLTNAASTRNDVELHNIISIVERLISSGDIKDREFWKNKFIQLYKADITDHLNRALIGAIGSFKDLNLLKENVPHENLSGELMYELTTATSDINSNDKYTIDILFDSIKNDGYNVYPKRTFERVKSKEGIKYYLQKLIDDEILLSKFKLNPPESFFLKDIIDNIRNAFDDEIKELLISLVLLNSSHARLDNIIPDFVKILKEKSNDFVLELAERFKQNGNYLKHPYLYNQVFAILLNPQNAKQFIDIMLTIPDAKERMVSLFWHEIYLSNEVDSKEIFEVSKGYFQAEFDTIQKQIDDYKANNIQRPQQYEIFLQKLEPVPGKYSMDVFRYYNSNRQALKNELKDEDKKRMKEIIENSILKTDFSSVHVTYNSAEEREYSISTVIPTFGEAIAIMNDFGVKVEDNKQKIIEYLPFAFATDRNKQIFAEIGELSDAEMDYIYKFYETERTDNTTQILIHNLFDICRNFKLISLVPKLKKVVLDLKVEYYRRKEALDIINLIQPDTVYYQEVFDTYKDSTTEDNKYILVTANEYLVINKNVNRLEAIKWRMALILEVYQVVERKQTLYQENLNSCLLKIFDLDYQNEFSGFISSGFTLHAKGFAFHSNAYYIWNTAIKYFDNLKIHKSYKPLYFIEEKIRTEIKKFNYMYIVDAALHLTKAVAALKVTYANSFGKPLSYLESIRKYNAVKNADYSKVNTPEDFHNVIEEIVNKDIRNWVEKEGAYKNIPDLKETLIQKTLQTQLWNGLLKRGLRDCDIRREEQLLDDKRTDFVINYGFIGQVLIEIKLCDNPEVLDPTYEPKLMQYIDGTHSHYGVFLIFQTTDKNKWADQEPKVRENYKEHLKSKKLRIIGLKCIDEKSILSIKAKKALKKAKKKPVKKSTKKVPTKKKRTKK